MDFLKAVSRKLTKKSKRKVELGSVSGRGAYPWYELATEAHQCRKRRDRARVQGQGESSCLPSDEEVEWGKVVGPVDLELVNFERAEHRISELFDKVNPSVFLTECPKVCVEDWIGVPRKGSSFEQLDSIEEGENIVKKFHGASAATPREAGEGEMDLQICRIPVKWCEALLKEVEDLNEVRFKLVPRRLSEDQFWQRLIARVFEIFMEETKLDEAEEAAGGRDESPKKVPRNEGFVLPPSRLRGEE